MPVSYTHLDVYKRQNLYMAIENDLEIIPVMNKIDLPSAMPEEVEDQIVELLGCPREDILRASGKTGEGVTEILNTIVEKVPAPKGDPEAPLQCLIFDSVFNPFRGIIAYFKVDVYKRQLGKRLSTLLSSQSFLAT